MRRSLIALTADRRDRHRELGRDAGQHHHPRSRCSRPRQGRGRRCARKPAEILTFAEVKPGQTVADLIPGGGYWTRIFSGAVGPKGHVYSVWPESMAAPGKPGEARVKALADEKLANDEQVVVPFGAFVLPKPADIIFTSQNVHDLPNPGFGGLDLTAFGKQVFAALKPGGALHRHRPCGCRRHGQDGDGHAPPHRAGGRTQQRVRGGGLPLRRVQRRACQCAGQSTR